MAKDHDVDFDPDNLPIPVFCTAEIKGKLLDELLITSHKFEEADAGVCAMDYSFFSSPDISATVSAKGKSAPPMADIHAPFKDHSLDQLRHIFVTQIRPHEAWPKNALVVLDERTTKDKTIELVYIPPDEDEELGSVRVDFTYSLRTFMQLDEAFWPIEMLKDMAAKNDGVLTVELFTKRDEDD